MSPKSGIDGIAEAVPDFDEVASLDAMRGAERLRAGRFRADGVPGGAAAALLAMISAPLTGLGNAGEDFRDETPGRTVRQVGRIDNFTLSWRKNKGQLALPFVRHG
jgi:hypothetical protein